MAYECFTSLVGVKECVEPENKYFINQTGLSADQITELMDDSYADEGEFFEAMKQMAAEKMVADILTGISKSGLTHSFIESPKNIGYINDNALISPVSTFVGVYLEMPALRDYLNININRIGLFLDHTGDVDVLVYNLSTGEEIATETISVEAGKPTYIQTELSISANRNKTRIGLFYDSTGVNPYSTPPKSTGCASCGNGYQSFGGNTRFSGASFTAPYVFGGMTKRNNTHGLLVEYSVSCDNLSWLCTMKSLLGLAYLYKIVEEIFAYGLKSGGQFSEQKTTNMANNEERYNLAQYEYQKNLKIVLRSVSMPSGQCFTCNSRTDVISRLPA